MITDDVTKGCGSRQEHGTEKKPVMVYVPIELHIFLLERAAEHGLSQSAFMVWLLRREKRAT